VLFIGLIRLYPTNQINNMFLIHISEIVLQILILLLEFINLLFLVREQLGHLVYVAVEVIQDLTLTSEVLENQQITLQVYLIFMSEPVNSKFCSLLMKFIVPE
jgi:hypothetical protein